MVVARARGRREQRKKRDFILNEFGNEKLVAQSEGRDFRNSPIYWDKRGELRATLLIYLLLEVVKRVLKLSR